MNKTTIYYSQTKRTNKFSKNQQMELMFDLINSFRLVINPVETANFLQDLLTTKEIRNLSVRLRIAKLLLSGNKHEVIVKELHCSYASVAKVSIWLSEGGKGFKSIINKLPIKYNFPKDLPPIPLEFQLPKLLGYLVQYSITKKQNTRLEDFLEGIKDKEILDKDIRSSIGKEFVEKHHEKIRREFKQKLYNNK